MKCSAGINHVLTCCDSRKVAALLAEHEVSAILMDLTMPYRSGEELLAEIRADYPDIPVIILSGMNQLEIAVRCIKNGAFDYFVKTVEMERLVAGLHRALALRELKNENSKLKSRMLDDRFEYPEAFEKIITRNRQMRSLFQYIEAVAQSPEPVLITGESGVGKELIARAVHDVSSTDQPWVAVNVAGLDDHVFADTLFGHARGAFTGADKMRAGMIEQASGGTLFLDEIGDLSLTSQVKLLRLLQEGEYLPLGVDRPKHHNCRFVVATNLDLEQRMAAGTFRKDLFYRLKAHRVHLPPLRERREDIPLLLNQFVEEVANSLGKVTPTLTPQLQLLLSTYHFPGNVRELRAMVYDALTQHRGHTLSMASFKKTMDAGIDSSRNQATDSAICPVTDAMLTFGPQLPTLEESAALLVYEAMERCQNNQTIAARLLGITRQALNQRLKKLRESSESAQL
jgi:DNA-binding NtrC family response regulator